MSLEIKLKSIDIDIETISKIYEITGEGQSELNRLKELKEKVLNIRNLLGEIETPKMTEFPISDNIIFKKLLFNIIKDDRFVIKKTQENVYLLSKKTNELLKYKNIDKEKFYEFLRCEGILITEKNYLRCRAGKKVYLTIPIELEGLNRSIY